MRTRVDRARRSATACLPAAILIGIAMSVLAPAASAQEKVKVPNCVHEKSGSSAHRTLGAVAAMEDVKKLNLRAFRVLKSTGAGGHASYSIDPNPADTSTYSKWLVIAQDPKADTEVDPGSDLDVIIIDDEMLSAQPQWGFVVTALLVTAAIAAAAYLVGRQSRSRVPSRET